RTPVDAGLTPRARPANVARMPTPTTRTGRAIRALPRAVAALALVACCTACAALPRAAEPAPLRVLVYNIHAGTDAGGVDNLARVAGVVRGSGADLVLLQEVDRLTTRSGRVDQVAELRRLTG